MRFLAKKNAGCPKAPRNFPPRKYDILYPRRVDLGLPSTSHRVCADGRTDVRTDVRTYGRTDVRTDGHVTITLQPKFLGLIGYQLSLAMELRWRALPAGSAISKGKWITGRLMLKSQRTDAQKKGKYESSDVNPPCGWSLHKSPCMFA